MSTEVTDTSYYSSISKFLFRSGVTITGLSLVSIGLLYVKQEKLLYFPEIGGLPRRPSKNPRSYRSPEEHGIRRFENIMIPCPFDDVKTNAWLLLQEKSKRAPTIIFFHGNAGNIGLRLPNAVRMFQDLSANILMVEYRGFGDSEGQPSEIGIRRDAEAALNYIRKHPEIDANKIFIFGRSLGGAVSFHLAEYAEHKGINVAGLIVENTFLSISTMVDCLMPFLSPFKKLVLRIGWDSEKIAAKLKMPILYLAGAKDELVPHKHMLNLYSLSKQSSKLPCIHIVKNGRHNETWIQGGSAYMENFQSFMRSAISVSSNSNRNSFFKRKPLVSGVEIDHSKTTSAIPLMPKTYAGMAKQAITSRSEDIVSKKQK